MRNDQETRPRASRISSRLESIRIILLALTLLFLPTLSHAQSTLCARVKIEIQQELTLERQAFDAHMEIKNGLDQISLENVGVDVSFSDADGNTVRASFDPNDTSALFFIRISSMQNIQSVDGTGTVSPVGIQNRRAKKGANFS